MIINIDCRERKLIELIKSKEINNTEIVVKNLELGDIIICDNSGVELLIIERKSLNDLAGSIKDGRYHEQSLRLAAHPLHNHNIIYLLEGNIKNYRPAPIPNPVIKSTIYSSICSILYFKGFSVLQTQDIGETVEMIIRIADKLSREKKTGYYSNTVSTDNNTGQQISYIDAIKTHKSSNITPDNFQILVLKSIPGIGPLVAKGLMSKYETINDLVNDLHNDKNCLDNEKYIAEGTGKSKSFGKKTIEKLLYYFKIE